MEHGADFARWMHFCQSEIEPIESVWNRRLEDSKESETNKAEDKNSDDDDADRENTLEDMLTKISVRLKGQRNATQETKSKKDLELEKAIQEAKAEEQKSKDDQERIKQYSDQAFWTLPDQYDIDALMDEME